MATLSDLVKALAGVTGLPEATVFAYGRFARQGGQIQQAGRGRSAASMSLADGSNLLMAVAGTGVTREAAAAVRTFRALRNGHFYDFSASATLPVLNWLSAYGVGRSDGGGFIRVPGDFGTFFEFLIRSVLNGAIAKLFSQIPTTEIPPELYSKWKEADSPHLDEPLEDLVEQGLIKTRPISDLKFGEDINVEVIFNRLVPSVEVEFQRLWDSAQVVGAITFGPTRGGKAHGAHRLQIKSIFTQQTLAAVGLVVADQVHPISAKRCHELVEGLFWHQFQQLAGLPMDADNVSWLAKLQTV